MKVQFNQEDLEERSKYLGAGEHEVTVSDIEYVQSKNNNAMAWLTFRDKDGAEFRDRFMMVGRGMFLLAALVKAAGFDLAAGEFEVDSLRGKKLKAIRKVIGKDTRDGKEYNVYENSYAKAAYDDDTIPF